MRQCSNLRSILLLRPLLRPRPLLQLRKIRFEPALLYTRACSWCLHGHLRMQRLSTKDLPSSLPRHAPRTARHHDLSHRLTVRQPPVDLRHDSAHRRRHRPPLHARHITRSGVLSPAHFLDRLLDSAFFLIRRHVHNDYYAQHLQPQAAWKWG